jgi:hypothetical protein
VIVRTPAYGSKFKAVNARDRNFTQAKMQRRLAQIDESIARWRRYRRPRSRGGKIVALRQEVRRLNALNTQMMQTENKQISLTGRAGLASSMQLRSRLDANCE